MCSTRSCLPRRMHLQWISCVPPAAPPAAPIPPRCCRPMPFWGTMPEPTRYRPPWACCPCLGQSRLALALRAAGFGAGRPGHCAGTARLYRAVPAGAALFGHGAGAGQTALRQLSYLGRPDADPHPGRRGTMRPIFGIWPYPARRGAAGQPAAAGVCGPHPGGPRRTVRRVHLQDPALPRLLERGGAVADFGWDKQGLVLSVRRME